jgi:ankyrin repeat protein
MLNNKFSTRSRINDEGSNSDLLTPKLREESFFQIIKELQRDKIPVDQETKNHPFPLDLERAEDDLSRADMVDNIADNFEAKSFFDVCKSGNIDEVTKYLKQGVDVNKVYDDGNTALHIACMIGKEEVIEILLSHKANPNVINDVGLAPIHFAYGSGSRFFDKLLDHGANPFISDDTKLDPFHLALLSDRQDIIDDLTKRGCGINQEYENGRTALNIAVYNGYPKVVKKLLELGADIDKVDKDGFSAIMVASSNQNARLMSILAQAGCDVNKVDNNKVTTLHLACAKNDGNMVNLLLKKNADVNVVDNNGLTPLHLACLNGNLNIVNLLMNAGANPELKDNFGQTALSLVKESKYEEIFCAINKKPQARAMEFHDICKSKTCRDFVEKLLEGTGEKDRNTKDRISLINGALTNKFAELAKADESGKTCFHYACERGDTEIFSLLASLSDSNADVKKLLTIKDNQGQECSHIACQRGHLGIVYNLQAINCNFFENDNEGKNCFHLAIEKGNVEVCRALQKQNHYLLDSKDNFGNSALHLASMANQVKIIEEISNRFLINIVNDEGKTALHLAVERGNARIVDVLTDSGANPFEVDKSGKDCYDVADEKGVNIGKIGDILQKLKSFREGLGTELPESKAIDDKPKGLISFTELIKRQSLDQGRDKKDNLSR